MKKSLGERIFSVINVIFMVGIIVATLYPIYHVLMSSFSDANLLMAHRGLLLKPTGFSTYAYEYILNFKPVWTGYKNTLIILVAGVALNMLLTLFGGYFLSRRDVKWRNLIMIMITVTMYFSGGIVPCYMVINTLGMNDSLLALIIPSALSTYNLIIMRTGFQGIPTGLEEAARIDGAGHMTILFRICVPVIMPTIAVLLLYSAVGIWNAWFYAAIFIRSSELQPLQLVLRQILMDSDIQEMTNVSMADTEALKGTIKYAVIIVSTVPILCLYPFLQRFFEKGVMVGSLKG